MSAHTKTPWRVEKGTGLVWGNCTVFEDGTPDRLGVPVTDGQLERAWSKGSGPTYEEMEANAAFIVKAVNSHEATQDLLTDIWFHFSATDDPTLRKIADRARELIDAPVNGVVEGGREP